MTIETRPIEHVQDARLERAVDRYLHRAGERPGIADGGVHWRCPDLCGASCRCVGLARRLKHAPCERPLRPTDHLGREEPR